MNTVVMAYGIIMIIIGLVGYIQSGSPTSFIGSAAGLIALIGGYLMFSNPVSGLGKWVSFGASIVVLLGIGMRLPSLIQKLSDGEETLGGAWVRLSMFLLSLGFAGYLLFVYKSTTEQTGA